MRTTTVFNVGDMTRIGVLHCMEEQGQCETTFQLLGDWTKNEKEGMSFMEVTQFWGKAMENYKAITSQLEGIGFTLIAEGDKADDLVISLM